MINILYIIYNFVYLYMNKLFIMKVWDFIDFDFVSILLCISLKLEFKSVFL